MKTFSTLLTTISKSGIESKVLYAYRQNKERLKRFLRWKVESGARRQEAGGRSQEPGVRGAMSYEPGEFRTGDRRWGKDCLIGPVKFAD
jgi:hypothetical protein